MAGLLAKLEAELLGARKVPQAINIVDKILRRARRGDHAARDLLVTYADSTPLEWPRTYIAMMLNDPPDPALKEFYRRGIDDPHRRYYAMGPYAALAGKRAFPPLAAIALDAALPPEDRAKAVKVLAQHGGQTFDAGLPRDPGDWRESDIPLDAIMAWEDRGFRKGRGHRPPKRHPALDRPETDFEKTVARFEAARARMRAPDGDPANPTHRLTPTSPAVMREIQARWKLPRLYRDFLKRFSPLRVVIEGRGFVNGFQLYGAPELLDRQRGYAVHHRTGKPLRDWNPNHVVIADDGGDPYVLDCGSAAEDDVPVLTAAHGAGAWDFHQVARSFSQFLATLAR